MSTPDDLNVIPWQSNITSNLIPIIHQVIMTARKMLWPTNMSGGSHLIMGELRKHGHYMPMHKDLVQMDITNKTVMSRYLRTSSQLEARPVKIPPSSSVPQWPFYDPWFENSPRGPQPRTKSGSRITVAMIPGVGIGKELIDATLEVFDCCGAPISPEWLTEHDTDSDLEKIKLSIQRNGVGIRGNIEKRSTLDIVNADEESKNFLLLEALDLFANATVIKSFDGLENQTKRNLDVIVIRSNTEGEYSLLEHQPCPRVLEHLRVISSYNTRRVAEFAFRIAKKEKRKKVTVLHQSWTMPLSEGLFVEEFLKVAQKHSDLEHEVLNIHRAIDRFFKDQPLDVVVSNSVYCTQLVHFMIGMIGGPRLVARGNFSERFALFEPVVNSRSRKLVGKNEANPTPYLLCGAYALEYLGYNELAQTIVDAIDCAFGQGVKTKDLGGKATTREFVEQVIKHVQAVVPKVICKYDKLPEIHPKLPAEWAPEKSEFFFKNVPHKKDSDDCECK